MLLINAAFDVGLQAHADDFAQRLRQCGAQVLASETENPVRDSQGGAIWPGSPGRMYFPTTPPKMNSWNHENHGLEDAFPFPGGNFSGSSR